MISSQCAWVYYTAIFIPSITYPFPVCHMNDTKLHNLQKSYIPALLNKLHFSATYARAMFFGSRSDGGLDDKDYRTEQGLSVIHNFMQTLQTPGTANLFYKFSYAHFSMRLDYPNHSSLILRSELPT